MPKNWFRCAKNAKSARSGSRPTSKRSPADWEATLRRDNVSVERVPVNRAVDAAPEARWEGDTLIVPVVEEEIVVSRRLVLREEIRIMRRQDERTVSGTEPLRRQVVDIERIGPDGAPAESTQ